MPPGGPRRGRRVTAAWTAIPVAVHLFILSRFWFDAPVLDDYDAILDSMAKMARATGLGEWLGTVFALQNEHRLAGTRLIPQILAWTTGGVDFRVLMLLGTLFVLGAFAFMWSEFRDSATGPIAAAAAFLLLQWSYNEALLMGSASTAHLGVVFFAFGALYFALRPGWRSAAWCAAGGVLAAYSQANGLFVLPLAGIACLALRRPRRAAFFLAVAAVVWAMYFTGYAGNPNHPSVLTALGEPVKTLQLFLIIIGGVVPSLELSQLYGGTILAALAWITWKGLWRRHPTAFLWIAFVLISAGTVAAARVGFGLFHGSRYAVNAALLLAILTFAIYALTKPWPPGLEAGVAVTAAVAWTAITIVALGEIRERSFRGRLLVEAAPASAALGLPRFVGVHHPASEHASRILESVVAKGWYRPPRYPIDTPVVVRADTRPTSAPAVGVMDEVLVDGRSVILRGWTHIAAIVPGRKFTLYPGSGIGSARIDRLYVRDDVAAAFRRSDLMLSGFRVVAEYPSENEARRAASSLCLFVDAPGYGTTQILRNGVACS